jgi:phosphoribosylformylglycinamidine cyclo-ligase
VTTYRNAGVDLTRYDRALERVIRRAATTFDRRVVPNPDGFAGLYALEGGNLLVACADGAGTKVKLAAAAAGHRGVGIDVVAMNVNDLIVTGARPLFFLDYVAVGKLNPAVLHQIIEGVIDGCRRSGCALLGGETAEMPGVYAPGQYDLAGFAVGIVPRRRLIDGSTVRPGDAAVALASSGVHANGFSLIRRALAPRHLRALAHELLTPTRIYVRPIRTLLRRWPARTAIRALAHITGGGIEANLPRVIPKHCDVELNGWPIPPIFRKIQKLGSIPPDEMRRVFNMGIGMILICPPRHAGPIVRALARQGVRAWRAGRVVRGTGRVRFLPD